MSGLILPNQLKQISSDAEMAKMDEELLAKKHKEEQQAELREAFMSRELHPEAIDRINNAVRIAAERGQHQVEVITFPCTFCSDGGRRINIADPEWPNTLSGFAKRAYDFLRRRSCALSATSCTPKSSAFLVACRARSAST